MQIDRYLSRLFPRSYRTRLLIIALAGPGLPAIILVTWLSVYGDLPWPQLEFALAIALVATVAGIALTLKLLRRLLAPIRLAADALEAYAANGRLPSLPEYGEDEVRRLMRGVNHLLHDLDEGLRELQTHALEDPLTGAMNRRGSDQALNASVARAQATGEGFVLFVLDLDNLKAINDVDGHGAGDATLVALVDSARRWLAPDDWVGRWGGDEFLLGVFDNAASAQARVQRWLDQLAGAATRPRPVSVSVGCASLQPGQDAVQLYDVADAAMYAAKFAGGHRLEMAAAPMPA